VSLLVLVYPIYVIRPFRYQGPTELSAALAILRVQPLVLVITTVAAAFTLVLCWTSNRSRTWQKVIASLCAGLVFVLAFLSRVNIYELMFHPLDRPTFSRALSTKLDGAEEVIAIRVNREARAYPIRVISYHHIVNDVVGGQPIVATY
jgi:hypothetical protein